MFDLASAVSFGTFVFAAVAAFISFQNFRFSGSKRVAEFRQEWLWDFRKHLALLFMELDKYDRTPDKDKIAYEIQYIDLMMDMRKPEHKRLKDALIPLSVKVATGDVTGLSSLFDEAGQASRDVIRVEQDLIEANIRRVF